MILGIIGLVTCFIVIPALLAFIFGLVAARQIKRSAGALTGSGLARAGWIMGLIGLLAGGAFIDCRRDRVVRRRRDRPCSTSRRATARTSISTPRPSASSRSATVDVVDCDEEHEAEVIQVGELNPDEDRDVPVERPI